MERNPSFWNATGKGVKIAIIDSGLSKDSPCNNNIECGKHFFVDSDDTVGQDDEWQLACPTSHGTVCCAVIHGRVPDVRFCWATALDERGFGDPCAVAAAIRWAVAEGAQVINMSFGMENLIRAHELREACRAASDAGTILVAACAISGFASYPSTFPEVIGVGRDPRYSGYSFGFYPGQMAEFVAGGLDEQTVRKLAPENFTGSDLALVDGTSISAARITANIAALLESTPELDVAGVRDTLAGFETRLQFRLKAIPPATAPSETQTALVNHTRRRRVAFYPFDEATEAVLKFKGLFDFEITCVVDPVHPTFRGRDCGEIFGKEKMGVTAVGEFSEIPENTEILIIGDVEQLSRNERRDARYAAMQWSVDHGKHVVSLTSHGVGIYRRLLSQAEQKNLKVLTLPTPSGSMLAEVLKHVGLAANIPTIGILGTSFNQGKLAVQLFLRRALLRQGYRVATASTNAWCSLLSESTFVPLDAIFAGWDYSRLTALEGVIRSATLGRPDILIVGCKGPIIPNSTSSLNVRSLKEFGPHLALPALGFVISAKPDAVILVVNAMDTTDYIRRSIAVIENLSTARVIALCAINRCVQSGFYGVQQRWGRELDLEETQAFREHCMRSFSLPVFCPYDSSDEDGIAKLVINSFAVN